ncbi:hypothetical protein ACKKBG_A22825 [Auxenochlorella protothecoides x Auxenochlorella symbiontica]
MQETSGSGGLPAQTGSTHKHGSLGSYLACLRDNPSFTWLWIAEAVNTMGSWFNYVAVLILVNSYSQGSGLALAGVVLLHFLPSLVLAPIAGMVADRFNRVGILIATSLLSCAVVSALVTVTSREHTPRLYALLSLQFTCVAFYTPARTALMPVLVAPRDLPAASTMDTFAWSLTGAVASSLGGVVTSKLGVRAAFLLDAVTYLVSAVCAAQVPRALGVPGAPAASTRAREGEAQPLSLELAAMEAVGCDGGARTACGEGSASDSEPEPLASAGRSRALPGMASVGRSGILSSTGSIKQGGMLHSADSAVLRYDFGSQLAAGWRTVTEGCRYLAAPENRDVAAMVTLKGAGSLSWGCMDIMNARLSDLPEMQHLGDAPQTMGYIFAMVGVGCLVGPLVLNPWVPPRVPLLLAACAGSLTLLSISYAVMLAAPGIGLVLLSTFIRALGSATVWIFSSLALQLRVPGALMGRVSAWEMALYTLAESSSGLATGLALDLGHASLRAVLCGTLLLSAIPTLPWLAWAARLWRRRRRGDGAGTEGGAAASRSGGSTTHEERGVYAPVGVEGDALPLGTNKSLDLGMRPRYHVEVQAGVAGEVA